MDRQLQHELDIYTYTYRLVYRIGGVAIYGGLGTCPSIFCASNFIRSHFAIDVCPSVCPSVRLSVCQTRVL